MIPGISGLKHADALAKWKESRINGFRNYTEVKRCDRTTVAETYTKLNEGC